MDYFLSYAEGLHFNGVNHPIADGNLKTVYNEVIKRLRLPNARAMFTNFGDNVTMKKLAIKTTICNVTGIDCPARLDLPDDPIPMAVDVNGGKKKRIRSKSRRKKSSRRKSYMKKKLYRKNKRKTKRSKLKH